MMWVWLAVVIYIASVIGLWVIARNDIKDNYDDGYGTFGIGEFIVIFIPALNTVIVVMTLFESLNKLDLSKVIMLRKQKGGK